MLTLEEVTTLIEQKLKCCNNYINTKTDDTDKCLIDKVEEIATLKGEIKAYNDTLSWLKNTNMLEQEKWLEILKSQIKFKIFEGTLSLDGEEKEVAWIQSSGFVLKDSAEYDLVKKLFNYDWLV